MHWREKSQPTPVFLPGESHEQRGWWVTVHGITKELDTTLQLNNKKLANWHQLFIAAREGNGNPLQYSCLENPMDGGAWSAVVHGVMKSRTLTERLHFHFSLSCIGEGNGNPLQCSCLENPRDSRAWWAAICEVAQSRTRLKQFSSSSSLQQQ